MQMCLLCYHSYDVKDKREFGVKQMLGINRDLRLPKKRISPAIVGPEFHLSPTAPKKQCF